MIDFEAEIDGYRPSLEVDGIEDAIVRSDLTDMNDIMMELVKESPLHMQSGEDRSIPYGMRFGEFEEKE